MELPQLTQEQIDEALDGVETWPSNFRHDIARIIILARELEDVKAKLDMLTSVLNSAPLLTLRGADIFDGEGSRLLRISH